MAGIEDLGPEDLKALKLGKTLMANPELRMETLRLYKRADPKAVIPEIELEERISAAESKNAERVEQLHAEVIAERVARRDAEFKARCQAEGVDVAAVEKWVKENPGLSIDNAIKMVKLEGQSAEPSASEIRSGESAGLPMEIRPVDEFRKLGTNRAGVQRLSASIASQMINEFRGRKAS